MVIVVATTFDVSVRALVNHPAVVPNLGLQDRSKAHSTEFRGGDVDLWARKVKTQITVSVSPVVSMPTPL